MQAKVIHVEDGKVNVMVRRGYIHETLAGRHTDLKFGDMIECHRRTNSPYLVRGPKPKSKKS